MNKSIVILLLSTLIFSCGKDDGLSFEEQLAIDVSAINKYLQDNNIDAERHSSEIRFIETLQGTGDTPKAGEIAVVKYDLSVMGQEEVIGMSEWGDSFFLGDSLLEALFIMLQEMKVGGKITFYAPSVYCFGANSSALIPANSNLKFDVELIATVTTEAEQFSADTLIIENYLGLNEIDAFIHDSGIRYTVETEGDGESPLATDRVSVGYKGSFLSGGVFDQNERISFGLDQVIDAWKIMVPTMKPGGKITIYAPSVHCYGPTGNASIPPNTILIFEIELHSIQ